MKIQNLYSRDVAENSRNAKFIFKQNTIVKINLLLISHHEKETGCSDVTKPVNDLIHNVDACSDLTYSGCL